MTGTLIEILVIVVLILFNGILAMSEIAIVSARKAWLQNLANEGDKKAHTALNIANSPNEFLSTVQIGITLVGIIAGAFGGATLADRLSEYMLRVPYLAPHADILSLALVVAPIAFLSLIVGELVPKRLALHAPEKIACWVALPMELFANLARPIVALLSSSTNMVLRLLGIRETRETPVTEAEIQVLVEKATEAGVFEEAEQEMLASVLSLGDRKVHAIMTPRREVVWIDKKADSEAVLQLIEKSPHARFVVAEESLDRILGIVESRSILQRQARGQDLNLEELMYQPSYVPESFTVLDLLELFRDSKQQLAVVMDEYGGLQGLVSREDILETIVGELPSQGENPKWEAFQREDGSWLLDGKMPTDDFKRLFSISKISAEEDEGGFHTLAGFILHHLEHIPTTGEHFFWEHLRFEIVDMDRHRIDKVMVSAAAEPDQMQAKNKDAG